MGLSRSSILCPARRVGMSRCRLAQSCAGRPTGHNPLQDRHKACLRQTVSCEGAAKSHQVCQPDVANQLQLSHLSLESICKELLPYKGDADSHLG